MCSQCLSHTGPVSARGTHRSGCRLFHREPSEAGPELRAPPRSKPLRFSHSGSPQRRRLGWACVLCPSQVRVAQVFGERGRCDLSPLPAALFSGCTTGAPPQADADCPEPQEALVSKGACLPFGRSCLSGAVITPFRPFWLWLPDTGGNGLQLANSILSFVLCTVLVVSYDTAFHVVAIPQSGLLAQVSSL